eukprot:EG_transcript_8758
MPAVGCVAAGVQVLLWLAVGSRAGRLGPEQVPWGRPGEGPPPGSDMCAGDPPAWPTAPQRLGGAVFDGARYRPLRHCVATQVIRSFCDVANIANADFNPDHVYAIAILSPAVVRRADGRTVAVFRAMPRERRRGRARNALPRFLLTAALDDAYRLASPLTPVGIPAPQHIMYSGPVDPRLFEYRGGLHLLFEMQRPSGGWTSTDYPKAEGGTYLWSMAPRSRLVDLGLFRGPAVVLQTRRDKNWVPLVWNDDLIVVRNYDPLELLNCSLSGHCDIVQLSKAGRPTPRIVRGGTPLLPYRGPYHVGLVHSNYEQCRGGWRWYTHQLVLVRVQPSFAVVYISEPLAVPVSLPPFPPTTRFLAHFCFPLGAVLRDSDTLDYGAHCDDRRSFMVRLTGLAVLLQQAMDLDVALGSPPPVPGAVQAYYAAVYRARCNASAALPFPAERCDPAQSGPPTVGPQPADLPLPPPSSANSSGPSSGAGPSLR